MKILILSVLCILSLGNAAPVDEGEGSASIYGEHFEGDIVLSADQEETLKAGGRHGRTGLTDTRSRWPKYNGLVYVPYIIDGGSGYSSSDVSTIRYAMNTIQSNTCVRFVTRSYEADYIRIFSGSGCYSYLGRTGNQQDLSLLKNGCVYTSTVMHELIHALGYAHMHQHPDRDSKVRINWENISDGNSQWFEKIYGYNNFGTPYDISSVMHYGAGAFSKNGGNTITAINSADQSKIGGSQLTSGDITRIRNMYQC